MKEIGTCKDCKYWERVSEPVDLKYQGAHAGCCACAFFEYQGGVVGTKVPKAGLAYWDYEGYAAGFYTGEDFGCIHWERKQ